MDCFLMEMQRMHGYSKRNDKEVSMFEHQTIIITQSPKSKLIKQMGV